MNYVATPDTLLQFQYYTTDNNLSIQYPSQVVYGTTRNAQTVQYTVVQATDHLLHLRYVNFYIDAMSTEGEILSDYYWTK